MKSNPFARLTAGLLLLVPLSPVLVAQESVAMKLDVVAWGEDIKGLTLGSGSSGKPVTALAFRYSKPVNYSGSALMEIHQDPAAASEATEGSQNTAPLPPDLAKLRAKDPTVVALAKLPPGSRRATVLIAPAQAGTYQTFVIDDDPSKLPFGKLRVHNYSPVKIAVRCNGKEGMEMKTKDSFLAEPKDGQVVYELAYDNQGKWKMQENNLIPVGPEEQVQFIVLKSNADFFTSSDGSRAGFLQSVVLRRPAKEDPVPEP
jgi:hypothetical protein